MDLNAQIKSNDGNRDKANKNLDLPIVPKKKPAPGSSPPTTPGAKIESTEKKAPRHLKINFHAILNWVIVLVILVILGYIGFLIYGAYRYQPTSNVEEIKLTDDETVISRINSSIEPGNDVSTSESGYGRSDPFEKY